MSGGGGGGSPIQTITGDTGGPVPPTANNINIVGGSSSSDNDLGITVEGNAGTSTETVTLTNRISGSATTTDAATTITLVSFPLGATPGTYNWNFKVSAYNLDDSLSAVYNVDLGARTTGAVASFSGIADSFVDEEGSMSGVIVDFSVIIVANTLTIRLNGLLGKTINWKALGDYIFVS